MFPNICSARLGVFLYVTLATSNIPSVKFEVGFGEKIVGSVGSRDVETGQH